MNMKDLRILISDDSILARRKTVDCLKDLGCEHIIEAENGQCAIDIFKANRIDVVFMDIVMPVKTGLEALVEILEVDPTAKVVIISSTGTQSNLKKAIECGAIDFIQKPMDVHQIKKILTNIIKGDE